MPKSECRKNVKCPTFPVRAILSAGRGLSALPAPRALRGVVEAVVSTACLGARRGECSYTGRSPLRRYAIRERVGVKIGVIT